MTANKLNVVLILRGSLIYIMFQSGIQSATRVCLHLTRCNLSNPIITKVYTNIYTSIFLYFPMESLFEGYD